MSQSSNDFNKERIELISSYYILEVRLCAILSKSALLEIEFVGRIQLIYKRQHITTREFNAVSLYICLITPLFLFFWHVKANLYGLDNLNHTIKSAVPHYGTRKKADFQEGFGVFQSESFFLCLQ